MNEEQLNEIIIKRGDKYCLVSRHKTNSGKRKNLGCYPSRSGAVKREKQVQYFKHLKESLEELEGLYEQLLNESAEKKKAPKLGKITRNPTGSKKKSHVYVKCNGKTKKISFGDPDLSIKRDSPERRKSFRARHKCDSAAAKNRCTAKYWSCHQWRTNKKVEGE